MIIQISVSSSSRNFIQYNEAKLGREMDGGSDATRVISNLKDLDRLTANQVQWGIEANQLALKKTRAKNRFIHFKVAGQPRRQPSKQAAV